MYLHCLPYIAIFLVTSRALLGIVLREPVVGKKRDKQLKICVFLSTVASLLGKISFLTSPNH